MFRCGSINGEPFFDYLCGSVTSGTTVSATASTETAPTCGATGTNDDVWFKFTATNSAHRVSLSNVSGTTDMAMAIYSGSRRFFSACDV
ncbi:hypothetical protein [Chryseobacterium indoltheticum]|uniref:hypothetical protein n=1 Tax=Chryseobacterium indoltheticum TaxID=254 RepID=UPI003F49B288